VLFQALLEAVGGGLAGLQHNERLGLQEAVAVLLKPKAFIVLKPGKTAANGLEEALKEHVKATAGVWKYPRWVEFVDGLPKTATGKIQRFKLREA